MIKVIGVGNLGEQEQGLNNWLANWRMGTKSANQQLVANGSRRVGGFRRIIGRFSRLKNKKVPAEGAEKGFSKKIRSRALARD
jgi:hypothetical protein